MDGGMGLLSGSYSRGITNQIGGYTYTGWSQYSGGLTIGSKSFLGGSIGTTSTSLPLYLCKFNKQ